MKSAGWPRSPPWGCSTRHRIPASTGSLVWRAGSSPFRSHSSRSFSAHSVFDRTTLVVNDALADDRFAENPLVVGEPRIRFYAGAPLILQDGSCVGSLSLFDTRPRWFAAGDVQLLEDLRDLVVSEMERAPIRASA